ncbi:MAG TPA: Maf family protein, partial [Rubricoccaceae bacterium]|nr:Maf family protein [Rubricoccaceae bacterium]
MLALRVPLVLASRSPRRRDLLTRLGVAFEVCPSLSEERWPEATAPSEAVELLALEKAAPVATAHPEALTLGADTVVVLDGAVLGKPPTPEDACAMLARLSGVTHTVYTGIALCHTASRRKATAHEATRVTFAPLSDAEISAYVATGSPLDKAGA